MMSDKVRESIEVALEQLQDERERIEGAIAKLEGFLENLISSATASVSARSKPATHRKDARGKRITAKQRSRAGWTEEARSAAAERMRQYWAQRREAAEQGKDLGSRTRRGRKVSSDDSARMAANDTKERSRDGWTDEARNAARERMRRYWQERKQAEAASAG